MKTSQINEIVRTWDHIAVLIKRRTRIRKALVERVKYESCRDEAFILRTSIGAIPHVDVGAGTFKIVLEASLQSMEEGIDHFRSKLIEMGFEDDVNWAEVEIP